MSSSRDIHEQLSAYLDGELSPELSQALERQIAADESLAKELAALRAARELLRALPREKASEDFTARVLAQAERRHLVREFERPQEASGFRWATFATAAIVLIAASICTTIVITLYSASKISSRMPQVAMKDSSRTDRLVSARQNAKAAPVEEGNAAPAQPESPAEPAARAAGDIVTAPAVQSELAPKETMLAADEYKSAGQNIVIQTDRLDDARRDLERTLAANGVSNPGNAAVFSDKVQDAVSAPADQKGASANNRQSVVYEVVVADAQLPRLQDELRQLQLRQNVSQTTVGVQPLGKAESSSRELSSLAARRGVATDKITDSSVSSGRAATTQAAFAMAAPASEAVGGVAGNAVKAKADASSVAASAPAKPCAMLASAPVDARIAQQVCRNATSAPNGLRQTGPLLSPIENNVAPPSQAVRRLTITLEYSPAAPAVAAPAPTAAPAPPADASRPANP